MTPLDRVHVGIIGCGRIATLQVLGYLDHPRAEVTAVCDRDEHLMRQRQVEWGAKKAYTDYAQLLADPDVNAVEILLPHHLHRDVAIAALQAGKHVSLQKPLTLRMTSSTPCSQAVSRRKTRPTRRQRYASPSPRTSPRARRARSVSMKSVRTHGRGCR